MTDEPTKTALQIALQAAIRDRDRAEATISFLSEKLGLANGGAPSMLATGEGEHADENGPRDVGPIHVADGEFYGMSQTAAAAAVLDRAGRSRPQRTEQIIAAIQRGGVKVGGKDPAGTFYKILNRDSRFHRPAPNTWGLSVWYPGAKKAKTEPEPTKAEQEAEDRPEGPDDGDVGRAVPAEAEAPSD